MSDTSLKITGTISLESYVSIEKYMLSPMFKIIWWAVVAVLCGGFCILAWLQKDIMWLVYVAAVILLAVWLFKKNRRNVLNRACGSIKGIRDGKCFDLEMSFDGDAIRVHNRATGLDTALSYELFSSYAETENCIALFIKTGTYLLVPRSNMNDTVKEQLYALLLRKCPGLYRRRF